MLKAKTMSKQESDLLNSEMSREMMCSHPCVQINKAAFKAAMGLCFKHKLKGCLSKDLNELHHKQYCFLLLSNVLYSQSCINIIPQFSLLCIKIRRTQEVLNLSFMQLKQEIIADLIHIMSFHNIRSDWKVAAANTY